MKKILIYKTSHIKLKMVNVIILNLLWLYGKIQIILLYIVTTLKLFQMLYNFNQYQLQSMLA